MPRRSRSPTSQNIFTSTKMPSATALTIPNLQRVLFFACDKPADAITYSTVSSLWRETLVEFKTAQLIWSRLSERKEDKNRGEKIEKKEEHQQRLNQGDDEKPFVETGFTRVQDFLNKICGQQHEEKKKDDDNNSFSRTTPCTLLWAIDHLYEHETTRNLFRISPKTKRPNPYKGRGDRPETPIFNAINSKNADILKLIVDLTRKYMHPYPQGAERKLCNIVDLELSSNEHDPEAEVRWEQECPVEISFRHQMTAFGDICSMGLLRAIENTDGATIAVFFDALFEMCGADKEEKYSTVKYIFKLHNWSTRPFLNLIATNAQLDAFKIACQAAEKAGCLAEALEEADEHNNFPLFDVICNGEIEVCKYILDMAEEKLGPDFLRRLFSKNDVYGGTCFMLAVSNNENEMFDIVLEKVNKLGIFKEQMKIKDENDDTALRHCASSAVYNYAPGVQLKKLKKLIGNCETEEDFQSLLDDGELVKNLKNSWKAVEGAPASHLENATDDPIKLLESADCWKKCRSEVLNDDEKRG